MVSSTGKLSVLADAPVVSTYICTGTVLLFGFVYIPDFLGGETCTFIRARFTAVYAYVCNYSGMYVCMVITYSKGKNQPGKVANPACGQLAERGK